ncbi:MAG: hypothetical protein Hals2KO_31160 [Halioglobus sp.]
MKFLPPLLLLFLSVNVAAIPIKWTSADTCPNFDAVVCGSFYFDAETGLYSFIDLTFEGEFRGEFSNISSGDQYRLNMLNPVPPVHYVTLKLSGFDLSEPVRQTFNWAYDFRSIIHYEGSSELIPSFEPPPRPVPLPGTFLLVGLGFIVSRVRMNAHHPLIVEGPFGDQRNANATPGPILCT